MTRYAFRNNAEWWRHSVVYQVFPANFRDTDGDGMGDLRSIQSRLDHLEWLGVGANWLSPIYPSPMLDGGMTSAISWASPPDSVRWRMSMNSSVPATLTESA
jgi:hypothetical protein